MLDMQMQMRVPPEEREQENHNTSFKQKLQKLVDTEIELVWGSKTATYEALLDQAQKTKTVERKVITQELQAKILSGQELTQEELESLR